MLKKQTNCMMTSRNFKKFVEQTFLSELYESDIHYTTNIPVVDLALEHFCKTSTSIVDKHAPFKNAGC